MKILLSAYTGLGNFVLKTPMIQTWKNLYPEDELHLIAGNGFGAEHLLHHSELITQTHILQHTSGISKKIKFFLKLRSERFDIMLLPFDAQPNFLRIGSYIAGIPKRIMHLHPNLLKKQIACAATLLFCPATQFVPVIAGRHETDLNLDLFACYHQQPFENQFSTHIALSAPTNVLQQFQLSSKPYILIQPGAANGMYSVKVWPTHRFAALIAQLHHLYGNKYDVVLCGDEGDNKKWVTPLLKLLPDAIEITNTAGKTTLPDLMHLIANAALVICHDSGVMHIADALSKPLIALYGPTDYTRTQPLKPTSTVLYSKTAHFAAMYNFGKTEADLAHEGVNQQAMEGIKVETVLEAISKQLG